MAVVRRTNTSITKSEKANPVIGQHMYFLRPVENSDVKVLLTLESLGIADCRMNEQTSAARSLQKRTKIDVFRTKKTLSELELRKIEAGTVQGPSE